MTEDTGGNEGSDEEKERATAVREKSPTKDSLASMANPTRVITNKYLLEKEVA